VKQATEVLCRVRWSDRPRWWSNCQPLFHERSDRLGSRLDRQPLFLRQSDRQPLFRVRYDCPNVRSDQQQRAAVESLVERRAPTVVQASEPHRERHPT
jgi:glycosyltransferase A (GT-A) superfamily protein (DUF2064 family)